MKRQVTFQLLPKNIGAMGWLWLVYLLIPCYGLLKLPFHQVWVGFLLFAVFVICFFLAIRTKWMIFILLQSLVAALLGYLIDVTYLYIGFYTAPLMGLLLNLRKTVMAVIAQVFLFAVVLYLAYFHHGDRFGLQFFPELIMMIVLPFVLRSHRKQEELQRQLNSANAEISRLIKMEERQRIARDLHDTLGHTLSLITVKSELLERLIAKDPEQAILEAREIQATSRNVLKQVRELVSDMQSIRLAEEIQNAEQILVSAGIAFEVQGDAAEWNTSLVVRNILGLCLRECITNVVKHSGAKRCTVLLEETPGEYRLIVQDDGIGIKGKESRAGHSGNGLLGMKERLALIEGKLLFSSSEDSGTKIAVLIPRISKQ